MKDTRFDRQILAFGDVGQQRLFAQRVGIVGLGGLGCILAQALVNLGVRRFVLIDDDVLSITNLNRWVLGFPADVGQFKVDLVRRYITTMDPTGEVVVIRENLRTRSSLCALQTCSTIFGCVDNDGARLILTELCAAYEIPLIDSASEVIPPKDGSELDFGGRVVIAKPGDFCLFCAGEIDIEEAKAALEDPSVQAARIAHGYGLSPKVASPSVVSLNGAISNLAVNEFLKMVTGLGPTARKLTYKALRGVVLSSQDERSPRCYTCGVVKGVRDKIEIARYSRPERNLGVVDSPSAA